MGHELDIISPCARLLALRDKAHGVLFRRIWRMCTSNRLKRTNQDRQTDRCSPATGARTIKASDLLTSFVVVRFYRPLLAPQPGPLHAMHRSDGLRELLPRTKPGPQNPTSPTTMPRRLPAGSVTRRETDSAQGVEVPSSRQQMVETIKRRSDRHPEWRAGQIDLKSMPETAHRRGVCDSQAQPPSCAQCDVSQHTHRRRLSAYLAARTAFYK